MAHLISLFLILSVGIVCLRQPVNGDKALIDKVCSEWTIFPGACHRCLDDVTDKDAKVLGIVSIQCAFTQSNIIIHDLDAIAGRSGDPAVKLQSGRCKQLIGGAISSIHQATINCNENNFDGAAAHMREAGDAYSACKILVQKIPALPADFTNNFSLLRQDYLVAEGIMDKL